MSKKIELEKLQEQARLMTIEKLEDYIIPDEVRTNLTLGVHFDGDDRIFELYVPGKEPKDALIIARTRLNIFSGKGKVEMVNLEKK